MDGIFDRNRFLEKQFQCLPCATVHFSKKFAIIEEIFPEDFWDAENEMTMWNSFEDFRK